MDQSLHHLDVQLKHLESQSHKQTRELEGVNRKIQGNLLNRRQRCILYVSILDYHRVFTNVLSNLAENFNKLDENKDAFTEKDHAAAGSFRELLQHKKNLINLLAKIEIPELEGAH